MAKKSTKIDKEPAAEGTFEFAKEEPKQQLEPGTMLAEPVSTQVQEVDLKSSIVTAVHASGIVEKIKTEYVAVYKDLEIDGVEDKEGYKTVDEARKAVKHFRIECEKRFESRKKYYSTLAKTWVEVGNETLRELRELEDNLGAKQGVIDRERKQLEEAERVAAAQEEARRAKEEAEAAQAENERLRKLLAEAGVKEEPPATEVPAAAPPVANTALPDAADIVACGKWVGAMLELPVPEVNSDVLKEGALSIRKYLELQKDKLSQLYARAKEQSQKEPT